MAQSAPAPVSTAEPKARPIEFSFYYEGPIGKRQTPGCIQCIAVLGMQPPHNCMPGCPVCAAGRTKICTMHQGMKVALDGASVPSSVRPVFEASRSTVEAALAGASDGSDVKLKIHGQVGTQDAPPRTLYVEVTLLNEAAPAK